MKIVIDIGNSYVKIYYDDSKYLVSPNTKDYYVKANLLQILDIENVTSATICSVVPETTILVEEVLNQYNIEYRLLTSDQFGMLINFGGLDYHNMGSDRVITTYSAQQKYGDNIIVFDLGTAITVDVLVNGVYKSGYIIPGSDLQKNTLVSGASMIGDMSFQPVTKSFEALDTNSQISDGILIGIIGSINSLLTICKNLFEGEYKVILTGGSTNQLSEFVGSDIIKQIIVEDYIVDQDLMSDGLIKASQKIWERDETTKH